MFGTLRNKFQTVQEGLSASIRGLTVTENPKQKKIVKSRNINYDAGADILHHFQLQWNELHELAEENASKAQEVDTLVTSIYDKLDYEWNNITCLNNTLAIIPKINNGIQNLMDQIGTLEEMFEEVEGALYRLEDLNEMLDLQSRQLDHRFQLALYKEKRLSEINSVQAKLANEHINRVSKHEQKQQLMLKERQETFDEVFKGELEAYKATGHIPKIPTTKEGPSLDEIVLDVDSQMFNEFLEN
ncbi:dysbindin protein homolog [Polistes fuscatus]|uniref:dysbindin protein homolog n=1 Tax=Polistes fuscatus TaxID=30207 RepID=UPI001CA82C2F|nr:dysbindin protein homolog [Polistes fuscatus]XP_043499882.1 dysbindin protein homolog [Polistes fuscatus]XP_043499883.1 dysbindin protein homolog [Polistes fuscatus]XP_043499884.1 dysbindin protein homolog [Polistes fuscatus]XP_043499885.1 dysbindin protein homolog [Polistes fuscatus]XP_043499886.1 dysbindin protein homolog [Polistes fuscatus]XP_043499888.1 dysbindin protein homolog [Polistes fuscatus]XP_043499889.1 dysbindin protein homolog [Polistes fuscatus]XP_043499890.1 dysbindin pr